MIPIKDTVPSRNPPLAVYALIALNVLAFAFELTLPEEAPTGSSTSWASCRPDTLTRYGPSGSDSRSMTTGPS